MRCVLLLFTHVITFKQTNTINPEMSDIIVTEVYCQSFVRVVGICILTHTTGALKCLCFFFLLF